jgi:hypothetical protein
MTSAVALRSRTSEPPAENSNLIFRPQPEYLLRSYGTKLDAHPAGKIVVFGLPKSGNTWLVSLLADYFCLPAVHPVNDVDKPGVGMNHYPYTPEFASRLDFLHAVYLVRDLRDVIVSYYYQAQTSSFREELPSFHYDSFDDFYFEWFLPRVVPYHDVHNHADGFMAFGLPVVRYEKLWADPMTEFARLLNRLGLEFDAERATQAVAKNSLTILKREGKQLDRSVPPSHFRKGGHGNFREDMPTHILEHANREFCRELERWGYSLK